MHHPKEAVIDGIRFVLIQEELLDSVKIIFTDLCHNNRIARPLIEEVLEKLEEV